MTSFDSLAAQFPFAAKGQAAGTDSAQAAKTEGGSEFFAEFSAYAQGGGAPAEAAGARAKDMTTLAQGKSQSADGTVTAVRTDVQPMLRDASEPSAQVLPEPKTEIAEPASSALPAQAEDAADTDALEAAPSGDVIAPAPVLQVKQAAPSKTFNAENDPDPKGAEPQKAASLTTQSDLVASEQTMSMLGSVSGADQQPANAFGDDDRAVALTQPESAPLQNMSVPHHEKQATIAASDSTDVRQAPAQSANDPASGGRARLSDVKAASETVPFAAMQGEDMQEASRTAAAFPRHATEASHISQSAASLSVMSSPAQATSQLATAQNPQDGSVALPDGMTLLEVPERIELAQVPSTGTDQAAPEGEVKIKSGAPMRTAGPATAPQVALEAAQATGDSQAVGDIDARTADLTPQAQASTAAVTQPSLAMQTAAHVQMGAEKYVTARKEIREQTHADSVQTSMTTGAPATVKPETAFAVTSASAATAAPPASLQNAAAEMQVISPEGAEATEDEQLRFTLSATSTPHLASGPATAQPALQQATAHNISQQLTRALSNSSDDSVELTLAPEELGKVRMVLHHSDQGMSVMIYADRPETLDLMRRNADMLSRDLRELGYTDVNLNFTDQGQGGKNSQELAEQVDRIRAERGTQTAFTMGPVSNDLNPSRTSGSLLGGLDLRM
ncbi:flagellar hook-length control protein FliK [Thioclava sp. GXIMD4216]|uniref:flagellar hook-length control protein FliK n=1 Tax=Thioclava sp. GXIMD4216 TaxID=3131929 RepID=UPI0030D48FC6